MDSRSRSGMTKSPGNDEPRHTEMTGLTTNDDEPCHGDGRAKQLNEPRHTGFGG